MILGITIERLVRLVENIRREVGEKYLLLFFFFFSLFLKALRGGFGFLSTSAIRGRSSDLTTVNFWLKKKKKKIVAPKRASAQ